MASRSTTTLRELNTDEILLVSGGEPGDGGGIGSDSSGGGYGSNNDGGYGTSGNVGETGGADSACGCVSRDECGRAIVGGAVASLASFAAGPVVGMIGLGFGLVGGFIGGGCYDPCWGRESDVGSGV